MNLQEECKIFFYEEVTMLSEKENSRITLVKHKQSGKIFCKKELRVYNREVYKKLMEVSAGCFPRIYECVELNNCLVVIEEFINGMTLEEMKRAGMLTFDKIEYYMLKAAEALIILHRQPRPVIHRDLKPANLMISNDGVLKLIDFNAAKLDDDHKTRDTVLLGTNNYAAPEQYGFFSSNERTDIYAFGVMFNELLTGKYPNENLTEGKYREFIRKCTSFKPEERYENMEAVVKKLERLSSLKSNLSNGKKEIGSFMPVGFRQKKVGNMILAVIGYSSYLSVSFSAEIESTGFLAVLQRLCYLTMFLLWTAFFGNYRGMKDELPLMGNPKTRKLGYVVNFILLGIAPVFVFVIIEDLLSML